MFGSYRETRENAGVVPRFRMWLGEGEEEVNLRSRKFHSILQRKTTSLVLNDRCRRLRVRQR